MSVLWPVCRCTCLYLSTSGSAKLAIEIDAICIAKPIPRAMDLQLQVLST